MSVDINGIAHTMLTVSDLKRSRAFYAELLPFLGLSPVFDSAELYYCVGGRTAFGLRPSTDRGEGQRFDQGKVGLHHVCFRARKKEDVDAVHDLLIGMNALIVHPPEEGPWAPGYYSTLFEDPDGIRLEVNFVPGKGLLG